MLKNWSTTILFCMFFAQKGEVKTFLLKWALLFLLLFKSHFGLGFFVCSIYKLRLSTRKYGPCIVCFCVCTVDVEFSLPWRSPTQMISPSKYLFVKVQNFSVKKYLLLQNKQCLHGYIWPQIVSYIFVKCNISYSTRTTFTVVWKTFVWPCNSQHCTF